jgi:hypothetical protein
MYNFEQAVKDLQGQGYKYLNQGSKRAAYLSPDGKHVVKIPINPIGIMENFLEFDRWRRALHPRERLAKCLLAFNNLLIMEYVKPAAPSELPAWADDYDGQVGFNIAGRLVAYDYGC